MPYKDPQKRRDAARKHYQANKSSYAQDAQLRRRRIQNWVNELKELSGCKDCGNSYANYVLDFDDQAGTVSRAINSGSWGMTKQAVLDRDIVCANCLRIRAHNLSSKTDQNSI